MYYHIGACLGGYVCVGVDVRADAKLDDGLGLGVDAIVAVGLGWCGC